MDLSQYFSFDDLLGRLLNWITQVGPWVLVIILTYLITRKIIKVLLKRSLSKLTDRYEKKGLLEDSRRITTLFNLAGSAIQVAIGIIFIFILLGQIGIDTAPLLASAGILGLAIGFGSQELVKDVISGFFLLMENHIRVGDVAEINGTGGLVQSIGLRTLTLRDFSGTVHVFQHGKVDTISNRTVEWSAMVFDIGVAYKEDPDHVMEVIRQTATELESDEEFNKHILEPLEIFGVDNFADSAVVIRARYKTVPLQQWLVGREFRRRLKHAFDANDIEIPFPHQTLYWGEKTPPLTVETK